jgi:ABC-type amino acid transport substrate-binding protein
MLTDQFHAPKPAKPFQQDRRKRANTPDTYSLFAKVAQYGPGSRVVAITNAHFVPFQGADAVMEFKNLGIDSEVAGFDPKHFNNPPKQPKELLQEILSVSNSLTKAAKS